MNVMKILFGSLLCSFGIMSLASCESDAFWGIEEDGVIEYSIMKKIAHSKEYFEFLDQSFLDMERGRLDTAQMVIVDYYEGKPIYSTEEEFSVIPLFKAKQELEKKFPEYENLSDNEKNQIFNIAVMNSPNLRKLADKYISKDYMRYTVQTKSYHNIMDETEAIQYIRRNFPATVSQLGNEIYDQIQIGSCTWYPYFDYSVMINDVITKASYEHKEVGGFYFWDQSAIQIYDPNATVNKMTLSHVERDSERGVGPSWDMHVHPQSLIASDEDYDTWSKLTCRTHRIYNYSGEWRPYNF